MLKKNPENSKLELNNVAVNKYQASLFWNSLKAACFQSLTSLGYFFSIWLPPPLFLLLLLVSCVRLVCEMKKGRRAILFEIFSLVALSFSIFRWEASSCNMLSCVCSCQLACMCYNRRKKYGERGPLILTTIVMIPLYPRRTEYASAWVKGKTRKKLTTTTKKIPCWVYAFRSFFLYSLVGFGLPWLAYVEHLYLHI